MPERQRVFLCCSKLQGKKAGAIVEIYKTIEGKLVKLERFEEGAWLNLTDPEEQEIQAVVQELGIEEDYLRAALDEEESPRVENENNQTLIVVDMPIVQKEGRTFVYTTIPLGIVYFEHGMITVCLKESTILENFTDGRVRGFSTSKKTRFLFQIFKLITRKPILHMAMNRKIIIQFQLVHCFSSRNPLLA